MVEQLTLNQLVGGSSPSRCTTHGRAARRAALLFSWNATEFWTASGIARAGFDLYDNTPEEIRDVTKEMMARLLDDRWDEFEDDAALQRYYQLMGTIAFMDGARTPVGKRFLHDNAPIFA